MKIKRQNLFILFIAAFISCQATHKPILPVLIPPEILIETRAVNQPGKFWLYFAVQSKSSTNLNRNKGLHKKNDLIEALPVTPQSIPTPREQSVFSIIKATNTTMAELREFKKEWRDSIGVNPISYRRYKFNKQGPPFVAGIDTSTIDFSTLRNRFQEKTEEDLQSYNWDIYKKRIEYPFSG